MKVEAFFQKNGQKAERVSVDEAKVKEGDTFPDPLIVAIAKAKEYQGVYKINLDAYHYIPHLNDKFAEHCWDCENGVFSVIIR